MSQSPYQCRWAILGLSNISGTFVKDILLPRDDTDPITHILTCVSTTGSTERAKKWIKDREMTNSADVEIFTSTEEMLKSGALDVVYISTPHPVHYPHAKLAILHGRHVLVEKPATMIKLQYEKLVAMSKEKNTVLMEAMWTRYLPATQYLQQEILPKIGEVKRVFSNLSVPITSKDLPLTSRLLDKKAGAGALLDMGVYALTWVDVAFGGSDKTKLMYANSIAYDTGKENVDDINTIVLSKGEGQGVAICTTSMSLAGPNKTQDNLAVRKVSPSVIIHGTQGQVSIPYPPIRPQEMHVEWYGEEDIDASGDARSEVISKPPVRGWGLCCQADIIAKAIQGGKGGIVIGEDGSLRVLGWMDEIREKTGITYDEAAEAI